MAPLGLGSAEPVPPSLFNSSSPRRQPRHRTLCLLPLSSLFPVFLDSRVSDRAHTSHGLYHSNSLRADAKDPTGIRKGKRFPHRFFRSTRPPSELRGYLCSQEGVVPPGFMAKDGFHPVSASQKFHNQRLVWRSLVWISLVHCIAMSHLPRQMPGPVGAHPIRSPADFMAVILAKGFVHGRGRQEHLLHLTSPGDAARGRRECRARAEGFAQCSSPSFPGHVSGRADRRLHTLCASPVEATSRFIICLPRLPRQIVGAAVGVFCSSGTTFLSRSAPGPSS